MTMDKEAKKLLAIISITLAVFIVIFFLLQGFELSGFEVHTGVRVK